MPSRKNLSYLHHTIKQDINNYTVVTDHDE